MAHSIKTPEQIEKMRVAGRLASEVLDMIGPSVAALVDNYEVALEAAQTALQTAEASN